MKIKSIISQTAFWQVNKQIASIVGLDAALLLTELVDRHTMHEHQLIERDGLFYFFATSDDIQKETTLSYRNQKNAIESLEKHRVIFTKLMGTPAKLHFSICENKIWQMLNTSFSETIKLDLSKRENINNNTHINNTINNKDIDDVFENLILPYDSENFKNIWKEWKKIKSYKTKGAEQIELQQLSQMCDNEKDCIEIICNSIKNTWKQFYALKKDDLNKFKQNGKSEQQHTINEQTSTEFLSAEYERRFNKS